MVKTNLLVRDRVGLMVEGGSAVSSAKVRVGSLSVTTSTLTILSDRLA